MTSPTPTSSETASWQTLLTLDRKSDNFTHLAIRLLTDQRHRKSEVSQFTEEEALELIELTEATILQHADIPGDLKGTAFTMLRRICGTFGRLPKSCLINEDFKIQEEIPFATCEYTDLWKRVWSGRKVAVKALRFAPYDDRSKTTKRLCKEVLLWKRLSHPNILPFYGASMSHNQFCMVSPWMENGNVLSYTRKNPEANRLQLLIDVASGLKFLHRMNLVHGNIRGSNILLSDSQPPRALLGDFGLNTIIFDPFEFTRAPINWTAPELLTPDNTLFQPSVASDIYALAMVIYEVLTGTPPFPRRGKTELACKVVLENERPSRPRDSEKLGFTDKVWDSLQKCWEKRPSARPSIDVVSACLKHATETWVVDVPAFMLASKAGVEQVMSLKEGEAKDFADRLHETLDQIGISQPSGKTYLKYLQRLCGASGVLPASFMLTEGFDEIDERPFTSGGFADVYRATYKGQLVVAKALKTTSMNDLENVHKRFAKEVVGWKWLRHENILPFVGVSSIPPPFSMVSVWMENGNIMSFIKKNPDQNPFNLLVDVTSGLHYLHQHDFVHGDLKGANVLINSECRACLADFGLTAIMVDTISVDGLSSHRVGGTIRWMAPEILDPERYGYNRWFRKKLPSKSMDTYALGMTILEVVTGRRPFEHVNPEAAVIQKLLSGNRPDRPTAGFSDSLWALLNETWLEEYESSPPARPDITAILEQLQGEAKAWSQSSSLPALPTPLERKASSSSAESTTQKSPRGQSLEADHVVSLFKGESGFSQLMSLERGQVQDYANTLDASLNEGALHNQTRVQRLKCLRKLCGSCGILPSSFILSDTPDGHELTPFASGGFSRVYRTTFKGRPVAIKSLTVTTGGKGSIQQMHNLLAREVIGWKWLQHENVLPFVGVTPEFAIVSDLMEHGNVMEFITKHPRHNRLHLLMGAASGLEYLHSRGIVHGDLKGINIFVDSKCSALVADFGLAMIIDESTTGSTTGGHGLRGTTRWMAPELLYPEHFGFHEDSKKRLPSKGTDIYALGMTILEVLTGKRPFNNVKMEAAVMYKVLQGVKPDRPPSRFSNALWDLLLKTWDPEHEPPKPPGRPSIQTILNQMKEDAGAWDQIVVLIQQLQVEGEENRPLMNSEWTGFEEAAANAYITPTPEVTGPTGQEGKQIPSPREIANRLKWLYELIKKIRETFRSFRMRDLK